MKIKHDGKPLPGATVKIEPFAGLATAVGLTFVAGQDGKVRVKDLAPGNYWLSAQFLGIGAAYHCFHVAKRPSARAKRQFAYDWGDLGLLTRRVAGKLIDSQAGAGGTILWNITHRIAVPISGAKLLLQSPTTGEVFNTISDETGVFAFESPPNGTYVLRIEGGRTGRIYDGTDLLIKVSATTNDRPLFLSRQEPSGGNCDDASLRLSLEYGP